MVSKKESKKILICCLLTIFFTIILYAQGKQVNATSQTSEDEILRVIKDVLINRDITHYAREGLISVGIDNNSLALNYNDFLAISDGQSEIIKDYKAILKENHILYSKDSVEARYFIKYSLSFFVNPFNFHIDEVWESGLLQHINGEWVILQQHASVPVTNDIWPVYLSKTNKNSDPQHIFNPDDLIKDFDIMTLALEQAHGRLYQLNPINKYRELIEKTKRKLENKMTELDFYNLICPIIASIKCGHTGISLSKMQRQYLKNQSRFIPFKLKFIDGKAFVVKSINDELEIGSEIISINNQPIADIVTNIFKNLCTDGGIITAKYKKLDKKFHEYYSLHIEQKNKFQIRYIPYNEKNERVITLDAISNHEWWDKLNISTSSPKPLLDLSIDASSNTAILTISKFVSQEINKQYGSFKQFADSAFNEINLNHCKHLIIDIRENGGGDIAHELLAYLFDKPIKYVKFIDTPNTRYSFLEYTDKGLFFNRIHPQLWRISRNNENRYILPGSNNKYVQPSNFVFKGKLYVLIDGNTFSGASNLAAVLKDKNRAIFFGEETGGCIFGSNSDDYIKLTLPNSGIIITIPLRNGVNNISTNIELNRGIIPEYEISNSIDDVLEQKDSILNFAINYINKNHK